LRKIESDENKNTSFKGGRNAEKEKSKEGQESEESSEEEEKIVCGLWSGKGPANAGLFMF